MAAFLLSGIGRAEALASIGTGVITADQVNVRSDAGVQAGKVATLPMGTQTVIDSVKADPSGKYWYQLSFVLDGKTYTGYVLGDYVKYSAPENTADQAKQEKKKKKKKKDKNATTDVAVDAQGEVTEVAVPAEIVQAVAAAEESRQKKEKEKKNKTEEADTQNAETGFYKGQKALAVGDQIRVRKSPVTGDTVGYLKKDKKVTLKKMETASDGNVWYKVKYKENGVSVTGYVRSDFLAPQPKKGTTEKASETESVEMSDAEFEDYMNRQGFPEGYKSGLRTLHAAHPNWTFVAVGTGLDWNEALNAESKVGLNLVSAGAIASWKSTDTAAYNWKKNTWYTFDGGSWVAASPALIAYYMDPRNFLSDPQIYQFESLEYHEYQNETGVKNLLAGTFMKGKYKEADGTKRSYAETFTQVGKQVAVNPYHLAARCYQEQGAGTSDSVSGSVPGFEGIYNYFNIGAYASGGNTPTRQGLIYASSSCEGAANYERPWNSRYQSILGGATYLAEKYIKVGQNTLYFQKFNVVNRKNGLYKHQYMGNVQAASSEAARMCKAYEGNDTALVFYIPVYKNMPKEVCAKPGADQNPNDYLSGLSVEGFEISPAFDGAKSEYSLTVKKKVESVVIAATPAAATSTVSGTGEVSLERGENKIVITCRSAAGSSREYTLTIKRK
ncbi:MAG: SH3 domain-containing protein [Lachnospiraceae bacterium]|nr:SH3 domain-containing protein [Lachnospiraceae bacterium]